MTHGKLNLPQKICIVCGRPFNWRKKWQKVWEQVKYCSEACRNNRGKESNSQARHGSGPGSE